MTAFNIFEVIILYIIMFSFAGGVFCILLYVTIDGFKSFGEEYGLIGYIGFTLIIIALWGCLISFAYTLIFDGNLLHPTLWRIW